MALASLTSTRHHMPSRPSPCSGSPPRIRLDRRHTARSDAKGRGPPSARCIPLVQCSCTQDWGESVFTAAPGSLHQSSQLFGNITWQPTVKLQNGRPFFRCLGALLNIEINFTARTVNPILNIVPRILVVEFRSTFSPLSPRHDLGVV